MPDDIQNRTTPDFFDRDNRCFFLSKSKKRQVVFKNEQDKLIRSEAVQDGFRDFDDIAGDTSFAAIDHAGGESNFHRSNVVGFFEQRFHHGREEKRKVCRVTMNQPAWFLG